MSSCWAMVSDATFLSSSLSQATCNLYPCQPGLACLSKGGRTCLGRQGCSNDDRRACGTYTFYKRISSTFSNKIHYSAQCLWIYAAFIHPCSKTSTTSLVPRLSHTQTSWSQCLHFGAGRSPGTRLLYHILHHLEYKMREEERLLWIWCTASNNKTLKTLKRCRDDMPKSLQTR